MEYHIGSYFFAIFLMLAFVILVQEPINTWAVQESTCLLDIQLEIFTALLYDIWLDTQY